MQHTPREAAQYGAIAVLDLVAWALRKLPGRERRTWAVEDAAAVRAFARSLDFEVVKTVVPTSFHCPHASVSIGGGHFTSRPTVGCGCTMRPIFQD